MRVGTNIADAAGRSAGFLVLAAVAAMLLMAPAPWFHDYSEWLFQARVLGLKWIDPQVVAGYQLADYPVPNSLAVLVLAAMTLVFPPMLAGKLFLCALLLGWAWLAWQWTARKVPTGRRGAVTLVLVTTAALSTFFWYGYLGYQLGLLLLFCFLLFCGPQTTGWAVTAWGIVLFFCHAMVLLVWGALVLAWALAELRLREGLLLASLARVARRGVPLLPASLLAAWYVAARWGDESAGAQVFAQFGSWNEALLYKAGFPLMLGAFRNFMLPDGTAVFEHLPVVYWFGVGANVALVAFIGGWTAAALWRGLRGCSAPGGTAAAWCMLALVAIYLFSPYHALGSVNPAGRLLLPLWALGMLVSEGARYAGWGWAAMCAACGVAISITGYALLLASVPPGKVGFAQQFMPKQAPGNSVFAFNDAVYSASRYRYFNYRVLIGSERLTQVERGDFRGLGFRTGMIVGWAPPPISGEAPRQ